MRIREQGGIVYKGDIQDGSLVLRRIQIQLLLRCACRSSMFIDRSATSPDHEQGHDQDHQRDGGHLAHTARPPGTYAVKHRRYMARSLKASAKHACSSLYPHACSCTRCATDEADLIRERSAHLNDQVRASSARRSAAQSADALFNAISLIDVITFVDFNVMVNGNSIGQNTQKITASMMLKNQVRKTRYSFFLVNYR